MNSKKILAFAMSAAMLAGCGSSASGSAAASTSAAAGTAAAASGTGRVYYLNFKPEADEY